jgi:hypothetical protein
LRVLDVRDPTAPLVVSADETNGYARYVTAAPDQSLVYLVEDKLQVLDVTDPSHLQRIGGAEGEPSANNLAFMGSYACVTGEGLQVFDLADPSQPVRVASHALGFETRGLQVIGDLVFVAAADRGLASYRLTPQFRLNPPLIDQSGLRLSWVGAPGLRLQQNPSLSGSNWQDVPGSESVSAWRTSVTNPAAFFRLVRP